MRKLETCTFGKNRALWQYIALVFLLRPHWNGQQRLSAPMNKPSLRPCLFLAAAPPSAVETWAFSTRSFRPPGLLLSSSSTILKAQSIQMLAGKEREDQLWQAPWCSTHFFCLCAIGQNLVKWPYPLQGIQGGLENATLCQGEEQMLSSSSLCCIHEAPKGQEV